MALDLRVIDEAMARMTEADRPRLCAQCARAFRPQALPEPPYHLQPYDLRTLDPQGQFCSVLCAARFGVAACEQLRTHPRR